MPHGTGKSLYAEMILSNPPEELCGGITTEQLLELVNDA
jgi:hypothetical protein